jgi:predicted N-acyltransferase
MAVEQLATIRALDRGEWDALAADDVFSSYGWLATAEKTRTAPVEPCLLVIRGTNGLDAAAACYLQRPGARELDLILFGRFAKLAATLGLDVGAALVCGPHTGLTQHVLTRAGAARSERDRWVAMLLDAAEAYAERRKVFLCFRNVRDDADPALLQALTARGYLRAQEMPYTYLDIRWASFREYLLELRRTHPATAKNIPREIKRGARKHLTFEQLIDAAPEQEALHTLLDTHQRRLNGTPFPYGARFLPMLREQLGDRLTLYVARKENKPVSVVVGLLAAGSIYLPMVGMDAANQRDSFVYFNNSYNVPIDDAITKKLSRVYNGKLLYEMKARRGYRLMPLSLYLHVPSRMKRAALRPLLVVQQLRIRKMLTGVREMP